MADIIKASIAWSDEHGGQRPVRVVVATDVLNGLPQASNWEPTSTIGTACGMDWFHDPKLPDGTIKFGAAIEE